MASMSRWFVGSSSRRMSGLQTSARAKSTRRFMPAESSATGASASSDIRDNTDSTSWCIDQPPSISRRVGPGRAGPATRPHPRPPIDGPRGDTRPATRPGRPARGPPRRTRSPPAPGAPLAAVWPSRGPAAWRSRPAALRFLPRSAARASSCRSRCAQQTHALAGIERQAHPLEQRRAAEPKANFAQGNQGHLLMIRATAWPGKAAAAGETGHGRGGPIKIGDVDFSSKGRPAGSQRAFRQPESSVRLGAPP